MNHKQLSRRELIQALGIAAPSSLLLLHCGGETAGAAGDLVVPVDPNGADAAAVLRNVVNMRVENGKRIVECNGIPDHPYGPFTKVPVAAQAFHLEMTVTPGFAAQLTPLNGWMFAVGLNGVVFDPTGPFMLGDRRSGFQFEVMSTRCREHFTFDGSNAHVQPSGEYHYHGMPLGLIDTLAGVGATRLLGFSADGFPVYGPWGPSDVRDPTSAPTSLRSSYRVREGERSGQAKGGFDGTFVEDYEYVEGLGDLDECNGRFAATAEYPEGTYHYVITHEYPFVPRFWRGVPDPTFVHPLPRGLDSIPAPLRSYVG